jgi:hypothetical protein
MDPRLHSVFEVFRDERVRKRQEITSNSNWRDGKVPKRRDEKFGGAFPPRSSRAVLA